MSQSFPFRYFLRRMGAACAALGVCLSLLPGTAVSGPPAQTHSAPVPFEVVHAFVDTAEQPHGPNSGLRLRADGSLWGSTAGGGADGIGVVYRFWPGKAPQAVSSGRARHGVAPGGAPLEGGDGWAFGTMQGNDWPCGSVYAVGPDRKKKLLHSFKQRDGCNPFSLVIGSDGALYGATVTWSDGADTIFKLSKNGGYQLLHTFPYDYDRPGELLLHPDGNLYGTTYGNEVSGSVFRITPAGELTTLSTFGGVGAHPRSLTLATDGYFYGVTDAGGWWTTGRTTVFRMSQDSQAITIADLTPVGGSTGQLMQARDGYLYGLSDTQAYRLSTSGELTVLHTFVSSTDGSSPQDPLVQGEDGYLYGAMRGSGPYGGGTIFRLWPGVAAR